MIKKTNMTAFFDTECPKCGHIAKIADDYVNNAEYTECPICGYRASLNRESNELKIEYGYGVIYISYQNRPFYYEIFEHPLEKHEIDKYMAMFEDIFIIPSESYFYLYDNESNKITVLQGSEPKTFSQYVDERIEMSEYERYLSSYRYLSCDSDFDSF